MLLDLAGRCARIVLHHGHVSGHLVGSKALARERAQSRGVAGSARSQPHKRVPRLAPALVGNADDGGFEHRRMLDDGRSDKEIVDFLVMRYGDFVMYKPPLDSRTWLLWYGPFGLLGLGAIVLCVLVLRRRKVEKAPALKTIANCC